MSDLISRQAAIEAITDERIVANMDSVYDSELHRCKRATHRILASLPSADAVPVVRCKDCKHWIKSSFFKGKQDQTLGQCDCNLLMRDADFFCKSGERKDG